MIVDKFGYGSFHNTILEDALRAARVRQVWLVGTVTQICVEETAREGFRRGFEVVVVADGVSSFDPELHRATLKNLAAKFAIVDGCGDRWHGRRRVERRARRSPRRAQQRMTIETADVLIIGAGASGGVVARRLAEAGFGGGVPRAGPAGTIAGSTAAPSSTGSSRLASSGRAARTSAGCPRTIRSTTPTPISHR